MKPTLTSKDELLKAAKERKRQHSKLLAIKLAEMVEANLVDMPGYVKEHIFHPVKKWRFDYAWLDLKVALEVHGGVFANGRHTRGKGFTEDKVKMNNAQLFGWIVIEVTKAQVINGQMLIWIKDAILLRGKHAPDQAISKNDT